MGSKKKNNVIIELKNVSFRYGTVVVLDKINLQIRQGDYWGVIGPNGAGKTTLLKIILGFLHPTTGSVRILGKSVSASHGRKIVGYVPQYRSQVFLHFPVSVEEVVMTGFTHRVGLFGRINQALHDELDDLLGILDLLEHKKTPLQFLSGGQRQKVFLARALLAKPQILILDEPSTGVDVSAQEKFYGLLKKLHVDFDLTVMLVSHDLNVITQEVEQVLCLNKSLVCRVPINEFVHGDYLEKLYGENIKLIDHHH